MVVARGVTRGGKGDTITREPSHYGGAKWLREAPKSSNNVTSTFFNAVNLLAEELSFEHGAPNLLLAPGAI